MSCRKRIAFDVTPLFYRGGVSRVTTELYRALNERFPSEWELVPYARYFRCRGTPLTPITQPLKTLRLPRRAESLIRTFGLIEKLTNSDLYHATDHYLPIKSTSPCIATLHDAFFLTHSESDWSSHSYFAKVVPPFVHQCQRIIVESEYVKRTIVELLQFNPDRIRIVSWGVNGETFRLLPDKDAVKKALQTAFNLERPYFFSTSCSGLRKNSTELVKAYRQLLDHAPDCDLVMTWNPPEEVKEKFSHPRIHFLGHVSDEQLILLYNGAKALIFPSQAEGFGLPILEAMSCGCPVLCADTGALPEVAGNAAHLFSPDDVDSIRQALEWGEEHSSELKTLVDLGLQRAKLFNWQATAEATLRVYAECLESAAMLHRS